MTPGSKEAIDKGCTCPILDNAHGKGYMGASGAFVISADCPVHLSDEAIRECIKQHETKPTSQSLGT